MQSSLGVKTLLQDPSVLSQPKSHSTSSKVTAKKPRFLSGLNDAFKYILVLKDNILIFNYLFQHQQNQHGRIQMHFNHVRVRNIMLHYIKYYKILT